jgi:hypothetical protein
MSSCTAIQSQDTSFVEEYKDGLVIGLEVIGLIALVADIFALVVF